MVVRIVTDSTSDVPPRLAQQHGIVVLPAYINIGSESFLDGVELTREEFYRKLPGLKSLPTTAAPAAGTFTATYENLLAEGASGILSIHIAAALSGILNAAQAGLNAVETDADQAPIELFDSRQLSMGLGLLALTAAEAANAGATLPEIVKHLEQRVKQTQVVAVLDTLEFLRRSGRVSWTEFGLGTLLRIKPLIRVFDSVAKPVARVRTRKRAINELITLVESLGALERMAILHTSAPEDAEALRQRLSSVFPGGSRPDIVEVTPAIGAHIGPRAVGIACIVAAP